MASSRGRSRRRKMSKKNILFHNIRCLWNSFLSKTSKRMQHAIFRRLGVLGVLFVSLLICSYFSFKTHELKNQQQTYSKSIADLDDNLEKEEKRTESISKLRAYVQTKKYAEQVARDKLGLVYPNEIIFQADDKDKNSSSSND